MLFCICIVINAGRRSHWFTGSSWDKMKRNANLLREAITTRSPSWSPRRDSPSARDATLCANCGSDWTRPSHVILPLCVYNARRAWPMCALLPISQRNGTKPNQTKCKCQFPCLHKCPHNTKCKCETPVYTHNPRVPQFPTHLHNPEPYRARDFVHCWWGICEIVRSRVTSQFMRCELRCQAGWRKGNEAQRMAMVDDLCSHSSLGFGYEDQGQATERRSNLGPR